MSEASLFIFDGAEKTGPFRVSRARPSVPTTGSPICNKPILSETTAAAAAGAMGGGRVPLICSRVLAKTRHVSVGVSTPTATEQILHEQVGQHYGEVVVVLSHNNSRAMISTRIEGEHDRTSNVSRRAVSVSVGDAEPNGNRWSTP